MHWFLTVPGVQDGVLHRWEAKPDPGCWCGACRAPAERFQGAAPGSAEGAATLPSRDTATAHLVPAESRVAGAAKPAFRVTAYHVGRENYPHTVTKSNVFWETFSSGYSNNPEEKYLNTSLESNFVFLKLLTPCHITENCRLIGTNLEHFGIFKNISF